MYTVYFYCTYCSCRRVLSIRRKKEDAKKDMRYYLKPTPYRCPICEQQVGELEIRDPFNQIIARAYA